MNSKENPFPFLSKIYKNVEIGSWGNIYYMSYVEQVLDLYDVVWDKWYPEAHGISSTVLVINGSKFVTKHLIEYYTTKYINY